MNSLAYERVMLSMRAAAPASYGTPYLPHNELVAAMAVIRTAVAEYLCGPGLVAGNNIIINGTWPNQTTSQSAMVVK